MAGEGERGRVRAQGASWAERLGDTSVGGAVDLISLTQELLPSRGI